MALKRAAALLLGAAFALVLRANPYYDPAKPHHTPEGFRNVHGALVAKPLSSLVRWRYQAWRDELPPPPKQPMRAVAPQLKALRAQQASATWIGHATVLVQSGGLNVLTDPIFSERASPVSFLGPQRVVPPGIVLEDLPAIDVVLVSHNHYDHLDRASVILLNERGQGRTLFLVPLGLKPLLAQWGVHKVEELDWWDARYVGGVEFQLVPVQHWSARGPGDRYDTLWGGWAVFAPDLRWYFSGDAGYSRDFADTRERLAPRMRDGKLFDLALLTIGAYEPRWFMTEQHMNPAEAVRAHQELAARRSIGIHWGTFPLTDEALDEPPRALAAARQAQGIAEQDFFVLRIGETWWPAGAPAKQ